MSLLRLRSSTTRIRYRASVDCTTTICLLFLWLMPAVSWSEGILTLVDVEIDSNLSDQLFLLQSRTYFMGRLAPTALGFVNHSLAEASVGNIEPSFATAQKDAPFFVEATKIPGGGHQRPDQIPHHTRHLHKLYEAAAARIRGELEVFDRQIARRIARTSNRGCRIGQC